MSSTTRRQGHNTFFCKPCKLLFASIESIMAHKRAMRLKDPKHPHFHCPFCGVDFKTEAAEIQHIQVHHAQKQDLMCPGCDQGPFARFGGLMQHIEGECTRIDVAAVEDLRKRKLKFSNDLDRLTESKVKANANYHLYMPECDLNRAMPIHPVPKDEPPLELTVKEFPRLTQKEDTPVPGLTKSGMYLPPPPAQPESQRPNAWDQHKTLFPDAPPAQKPTQELLQHVTAAGVRVVYENLDPHHPSHPQFNAKRYYNEYSQSYDCSKVSCRKTFKTARGMISHLYSQYHNENRYRCPYCHKTFGSLSAISQHAESQGNFCRIRDTKNFNTYLDQLTAGLVNVSLERNQDGTVKYYTPEAAREVFRGKEDKEENSERKAIEEPPEDPWGKPPPADDVW